jgi:hypothetical protein
MGVERFYSGILNPSGGVYQGTDGGGIYDGILPGASAAPSGELTTRSVKTVKIDPYTGQPVSTPTTPGLTAQQLQALQAIRAVPANSYQRPPNQPLNLPNEPRGFSFADTGDYGRASGPMTQQLAIAGKSPTMLAGMFGRGISLPGVSQVASASVPLPRARPASAPWAPELAAALSPDATLGDLLAYAQSSSPSRRPNPAVNATSNLAGAAPGTSLSGLFGNPRASVRPADAYAAANALGQIAAQQRRAAFTGVGTNGYTYVNGKNVGYSAEELAKREALGKAIGDANRASAGNSTHDVAGNNNAFMSTDHQNSTRWQTGY